MANSLVSIKSGTSASYVDLPCPIDYAVNSTTIVDNARNGDGKVVGSVIRNSVRSITLKWNFLSLDDMSTVAKLFDKDYGGDFYFSCKFFDPTAKAWLTKDMYVGDRPTNTAHIKLVNDMPVGYTDVELSLIEV